MMPFSQRNAPKPDHYRYTIDDKVRNRLLLVLREAANKNDFRDGFTRFRYQLGQKLQARYGYLRSSHFEAARRIDNVVIEHFFCCRDEEVIDFLVFAFQTDGRCDGQATVAALNDVLSEEHIGYELTDLITEYEHRKSKGPWLIGGTYEPKVI